MARMSIDDKARNDPRITHLAKLQGWSLRETRGCIAFEVWPLCYSMVSVYLRRIDIELATDSPTLADNLITCGLATETKRGLRIAGASERIEYLLRAREAGRRGGKASGKSRASNEPYPVPSTNPSRKSKPPDTASASASAPDSVPSPVPEKNAAPPVAADPLDFLAGFNAQHHDESGPEPEWWGNEKSKQTARAPVKSRAPSGPHQEAVAAFHAYFQRTNGGSSPTWNAKAGKLVQGILSKHGLPEYLRRLQLLEQHPPSFPPTPWDLATFAQHFDRIAVVRRPKTATDIALAIANGETP